MDSPIALLILSFGFLIGIILVVKPKFGFSVLIFSTMVVSGLVEYFFPALGQIKWANVILSIFLFLRALGDKFHNEKERMEILPSITLPMSLFFFVIFITTVYNRNYVETILGLKNYLQFWPVPFILMWSIKDIKFNEKCLKFFVLLAVCMPAVTLFQKFVLHAQTDTITGTFGSSYVYAGGPNAVLSVFVLLQIGFLLLSATEGEIRLRYALLGIGLCCLTIVITSARAIIGFIGVLFLFLYGQRLLRFDMKAILALLVFGAMLVVIVSSYFHIAQKKEYTWVKPPEDLSEMYDQAISNNFGEERYNRFTSIVFWWTENMDKKIHLLIGYGVGATKFFGLKQGRIQKRYGEVKLGITALSSLLWEVGIVGLILYVLVFLRSFMVAGRLKKNVLLSSSKKFLTIAQVACLFAIITIPYKFSLIGTPAFNFYTMFNVGYIAYLQKKVKI